MAELTPMKKQYNEIKQQHQDCLLFLRLGDFYEMFNDDAKIASRELDLALTTRDRSVEDPDERTPMCGVPYHSAEAYIARLIAKGYKVAICEQTEDPALAKGLVQRDVIRIITPGTVTESSMLEEGKSTYIGAVYLASREGGVAFCDVSTGEFCCAAFDGDAVSHIINELGRFAPRVKYSFSVMGGTSPSGRRSWMTVLSLSKSIVETYASPASFFCFAIMELKPPMVSDSSPDIEPLRSKIKTNSVIMRNPPSFDYACIVAKRKEGLVACQATIIRLMSSGWCRAPSLRAG